jgi:hypothetical protein
LLNQTITLALFEAINPSINEGCTNLDPGLYYCIFPLSGWNATSANFSTLTAVAAPAPTTPGAISPCYEWYTIQENDNCQLMEIEYGITFAELVDWNPNLNSTCGNLDLGAA